MLSKEELASERNIYNQAIIKPRLPSVLDGSLKNPPLTLSHHLEMLPISDSFAAGGPHPSDPVIIKVIVKRKRDNKAYLRVLYLRNLNKFVCTYTTYN